MMEPPSTIGDGLGVAVGGGVGLISVGVGLIDVGVISLPIRELNLLLGEMIGHESHDHSIGSRKVRSAPKR